ncbi:MAG TPA: DNA recombination protein RmuC [Gemmatimonadales bacterium]|nr:DNA recombination protein RmuC [Gemmatimonadales bacterium]
MFDPFLLLPFAFGLALGLLLCWLVMRGNLGRLEAEIAAAERFRDRAQASIEAHNSIEQRLRDVFGALSSEALQANNAAFIDQARLALEAIQARGDGDLELKRQAVEHLVEPIRKGLEQVDQKLQALDQSRAASQGALEAMLKGVGEAHQALTAETHALVSALRTPTGRGQWGEMQLQRVVELAGMMEHCDFASQETVNGENGSQRPDLVVRLPGDKVVVVDAKAPLSAYLEAIDASDDTARNAALDRHAQQVRTHIEQLAGRDYSDAFAEAPDFVVLFLPGEAFFAAACQRDPSLLDDAVSKGVIPASPTTLITLLKAVHFGWQQERIARNAEEIRDLGIALHDRTALLTEHLVRLRRGLETAVRSYNEAMGSLERRVLPTARRFRELGLSGKREIQVLRPVEGDPLRVTADATP